MIRALELRAHVSLHAYSDAMSQYFEQAIRDFRDPSRLTRSCTTETNFPVQQTEPGLGFHDLDAAVFADAKPHKVVPEACRHRRLPRY